MQSDVQVKTLAVVTEEIALKQRLVRASDTSGLGWAGRTIQHYRRG
jgi:hypothetical protein